MKRDTSANRPFINRQELAERWRCSPMKIKRMSRARVLPFLKMGRSVLYRISDVERIEEKAEVGAA